MCKEEISTTIINNLMKYEELSTSLNLLQKEIFNLWINKDENYLENLFELIINFAKQDILLREMVEECFDEFNLSDYFIDKIGRALIELSSDDEFYRRQALTKQLSSILEQKKLYDCYHYLSCYAYYTQDEMQKIFKQSSPQAVRRKVDREMGKLKDAGVFELLNIYDNPEFMYTPDKYNNVKIIRFMHNIFKNPIQNSNIQHKKYKK